MNGTRRVICGAGLAVIASLPLGLAAAAASTWKVGLQPKPTSTAQATTVPNPPASLSSTTQTKTTITIMVVTGPVGGLKPSSYRVDRTSAAAPGAAVGVCTINAVGGTCTDNGPLTAATTYNYTVFSLIGTNWVSAKGATLTQSTR